MLVVGLEEDDDGVELRVVEAVHGVGRDVQQRVLAALHHAADAGQTDDARRLGLAVLQRAVHFWGEQWVLIEKCKHTLRKI